MDAPADFHCVCTHVLLLDLRPLDVLCRANHEEQVINACCGIITFNAVRIGEASETPMVEHTNKLTWLCTSAFLGTIIYILFTWISASHYPGTFGPITDYLSVLGNSGLNPEGAVFYNLGVASTGLLLIPFYVGLYLTFGAFDKSKAILISGLIGLLNGASIVLSAVFSEDFYDLHFIWSFMIFLTWIPILFLTNVHLVKQEGILRPIGVYGLGLAIFDTAFVIHVLTSGTSTGAINEWITIFAFLGWTILIGLAAIRNHWHSSSIHVS